MSTRSRVYSREIQRVHYMRVPSDLKDSDLADFELDLQDWRRLDVDMHVFDVNGLKLAPNEFFNLVRDFSGAVAPKKTVSLNVTDDLLKEIETRQLTKIFNRVSKFPEDLIETRKIADHRPLLIKYIVEATRKSVEEALHSSLKCDLKSLTKPLPLEQFDLISVVDVNNAFLKVQFRLCATLEVMKKASCAMLGDSVALDNEMVEGMAGELLNWIYGMAKSQLNDKESFRLPPCIPKVVNKSNFNTIARSKGAFAIPMVTPLGTFYVEVDIAS